MQRMSLSRVSYVSISTDIKKLENKNLEFLMGEYIVKQDNATSILSYFRRSRLLIVVRDLNVAEDPNAYDFAQTF